ncbi:MAG: septation regulator SpoVG [Bacilli bacterium]|nr:septation regulator SpoVG [Bacilli bacterium]
MQITDVRMRKVDNGSRLKAVATITFDNVFVVHELRVIEGTNGLFVAMPNRKNNKGLFKDIAHPIEKSMREEIEQIVLDKYNSGDLDEVEAEE